MSTHGISPIYTASWTTVTSLPPIRAKGPPSDAPMVRFELAPGQGIQDVSRIAQPSKLIAPRGLSQLPTVTELPKDNVYPRDFAHIYGVLDDRYNSDPSSSLCVWDMVCLAVVHAFGHGRKVAGAVSHQLTIPVLVEQVAVRAAVGCFWDALADFAATAWVPRVPRRHRIQLLTCQPFIAWHTVLRGNGLRVVRR
jgi:hypothetical protein